MKPIDILKDHKFIILGDGHFNTLGMVRSLGEAGIRPIVVMIAQGPTNVDVSRYIGHLHTTPSIEDGLEYIIANYSHEEQIPFLLTGSDKIIAVIDRNYDRLAGKFHFFNTGEQGRINRLLSKKEQNVLAEQCGFNVPAYEEVRIGDLPTHVPYPLITKAVDSTVENWKGQTFLCHNEAELREAYAQLQGERILLQQYIEKTNETGFDALTIDSGRRTYLPLQLSYYETTATGFGNHIYFFKPTDDDLLARVAALMEKTRYSGIFSIDLLMGKDGKIYFLEINFRNSAWSYPSTCAGVNLPVIWAMSVLRNELDTGAECIKRLPFSAISDQDELARALHTGLGATLKTLKNILCADSRVIWNRRDQRPFWRVVKGFISRRV